MAMLLVAAACGGSDDEAATDGETTGAEPATSTVEDEAAADGDVDVDDDAAAADDALTTPTDWRIFDLLSQLPATGDNLIGLSAIDLTRTTASSGLSPPDPDDPTATDRWLLQLTGFEAPEGTGANAGLLRGIYTQGADVADWRLAFGFSVLETEALAIAGSPPTSTTIFAVSVPPEEIEQAVTTDPVWSGDLRIDDGPAGPIYVWSDDGSPVPDRISGARPLGRGGLLAPLDDGLVIRTLFTEPMEASLTARRDGTSLADVPALVELVNALDAAGVYSFLVTNGSGPTPDVTLSASPEELREELEADLADARLVPFGFAAAATAADGREQLAVVAYVHGSPEAAAANVARITELFATGSSDVTGAPWSELFAVRSATSTGSVSIAVLEPVGTLPASIFQAVFQRDNLFWIGG